MRRHKSHHQEKGQCAHQIVQRGHGDEGAGHRAVGLQRTHHRERRRGRGGQGDAAEQERHVKGRAREPEDDAEHKAHHQKSPQRFGEGGDQNLGPGLFHPFPDELRADHQAEHTFKKAFQHAEPPGVQHRPAQQAEGVGADDHARDQPTQNGGQLQPGDQFARRERDKDSGQQPQHVHKDLHKKASPLQ